MYTPVNSCSGIVHLFLKHPILVIALGLMIASGFVRSDTDGTNMTVEEYENSQAFIEKIEEVKKDNPEAYRISQEARYAFMRILIIEQGLEAYDSTKSCLKDKDQIEEQGFEEYDSSKSFIEEVDFTQSFTREDEEVNDWIEEHQHLFVYDGEHGDGVSYGPAGLTRGAYDDVVKKCYCAEDDNGNITIGEVDPGTTSRAGGAILYDSNQSPKIAYLYFLDLVHKFGNVKHAVMSYNAGPTRIRRLIREDKELPYKYYYMVMYHVIERDMKNKTDDDWFEAAYKLCPISNPTLVDYINRNKCDHQENEIVISKALRKKYARKHFQTLLDRFNDVQLATTAYYYGVGAVDGALNGGKSVSLDFTHRVKVEMM